MNDAEKHGLDYQGGTYVVCDEIGRPYHPDSISGFWESFTVAAGVRRLRLHDCRHSCGTLMHLQGVPIAVVAAWLGHADSAFTMRTYVHAQDGALTAGALSLQAVMGSSPLMDITRAIPPDADTVDRDRPRS